MLPNRSENGAVLWTCTGSDAQVPGGEERVIIKTVYVHKPAASLPQSHIKNLEEKKCNFIGMVAGRFNSRLIRTLHNQKYGESNAK